LIVGLGNPGRKYDETRHNIGFEVLGELKRKFGSSGVPRSKFDGEFVEASIRDQKVLLVWPHTFMNNSGSCVLGFRDFYKVENGDILIVCDDLSLPVAKLRFRAKGSSGGQKGLQDVVRRLGSEEVPRLRLGIGSVPEGWDAANYVLSRFTSEEVGEIKETVSRAASASADWVEHGTEYCMNTYNANK
jgi:PTH1 family peptidyl-tRNA hydrolase